MPFCSLTLTAKKPSKTPINPKTIGEHIRKRRLELGLTQVQLAGLFQLAECTITNWEKNHTRPQLHLMSRILQFLDYRPVRLEAKSLSEKLVQYRRTNGITQKELAKGIGIDPTTLSRIERNSGRIFPSTLQKVLGFLEGRFSD